MRRILSMLIGGLVVGVWSGQARAVNIDIDYRYDTTSFFGAGNPSGAAAGQQARDALEAAADYFSQVLTDTFSAITTPPTYHSQVSTGLVEFEWSAGFTHPSAGSFTLIDDEPIVADQYLIFAGARSLGGMTAGIGGAGSWGYSVSPSGLFSQDEIDEVGVISDQFVSDVTTRGETSGFVSWGGSIAFDRDGSTTWFYDHTTAPTNNTVDFYSVAIHELAHALGFGGNNWESLVAGSFNNYYFTGSASNSAYGGLPPVDNDRSHWAEDTMSTVYGGTTTQEAAMDPDILDGTRKHFTALDAAGLTDLGWELTPPVAMLVGDLNGDGFVGLADLDIVLGNWNASVTPGDLLSGDPSGDGFVGLADLDTVLGNWNAGTPPAAAAVPEPASLLLAGLAAPFLMGRRRRG